MLIQPPGVLRHPLVLPPVVLIGSAAVVSAGLLIADTEFFSLPTLPLLAVALLLAAYLTLLTVLWCLGSECCRPTSQSQMHAGVSRNQFEVDWIDLSVASPGLGSIGMSIAPVT